MSQRLYKILVIIFIFCVLAPNFCVIIRGHEDWPYTPAPMFAHYIDENTPRFAFNFTGEFDDGSSKKLGYYSVGANWSLMRLFFKYVYGAMDPGSVFEEFPNDNLASFETRLTRFFRAFTNEYSKRNMNTAKLIRIKLSVAKLAPKSNEELESHTVGFFENGSFKHSWGKAV